MWTEITRPKYERAGLRYASELTCAEWDLIEPYIPPAKAVGRPQTTHLREVVTISGNSEPQSCTLGCGLEWAFGIDRLHHRHRIAFQPNRASGGANRRRARPSFTS